MDPKFPRAEVVGYGNDSMAPEKHLAAKASI